MPHKLERAPPHAISERYLSAEDGPTVTFAALCALIAAFLVVSAMYWMAADTAEESVERRAGNPVAPVSENADSTTGSRSPDSR